MRALHLLDYDERTDVFTLTTIDDDGEHITMFTAPRSAPVFNVLGLDCVAFRACVES